MPPAPRPPKLRPSWSPNTVATTPTAPAPLRSISRANERARQRGGGGGGGGGAEKVGGVGERATAGAQGVLNPLTGVKTALQLLARDEPSDGVRDTVTAVDAEIRRVEGLARRLMGFARPL